MTLNVLLEKWLMEIFVEKAVFTALSESRRLIPAEADILPLHPFLSCLLSRMTSML